MTGHDGRPSDIALALLLHPGQCSSSDRPRRFPSAVVHSPCPAPPQAPGSDTNPLVLTLRSWRASRFAVSSREMQRAPPRPPRLHAAGALVHNDDASRETPCSLQTLASQQRAAELEDTPASEPNDSARAAQVAERAGGPSGHRAQVVPAALEDGPAECATDRVPGRVACRAIRRGRGSAPTTAARALCPPQVAVGAEAFSGQGRRFVRVF